MRRLYRSTTSTKRILTLGAPVALLVAAMAAFGAVRAEPTESIGLPSPKTLPFQQPGHVHHPPGSVIGAETPHLIPTELAIRILFRVISDQAKKTDGASLANYFAHMEKATASRLAAGDRDAITATATAYAHAMGPDSRGDAPALAAAAQMWLQLEGQLSPSAAKAMQQFLDTSVKPGIKILKKKED